MTRDTAGHDPGLDRATVETLLGNERVVRALEREYGFKSFFYWQPAVYNKDVLSEDEKTKIKKDSAFADMYLRVTELIRLQESITDLSDILDEYSRTFFIDEFHISEEGTGSSLTPFSETCSRICSQQGRWPVRNG